MLTYAEASEKAWAARRFYKKRLAAFRCRHCRAWHLGGHDEAPRKRAQFAERWEPRAWCAGDDAEE